MTDPEDSKERAAAIAWGKKQLNAAITDLGKVGIIDVPVVEGRVSWMLPHKILIGELRETGQQHRALWLIGGDFPTDHVDAALAESPRDAARHFALKWQMDAARQESDAGDPVANDKLSAQAEFLYAMVQADEVWD